MAGIDKIYLNKQDALEFYHYLQSIDGEFKAFFKNADSIMDYVYGNEDSILNWQPHDEDSTIPVTNFPECVDAWLLRRDDLPTAAKNYMCEYQYDVEDSSSHLLKEPIKFLDDIEGDISMHFKIIKKQGCFNESLSPLSYYTVQPLKSYWIDEGGIVYIEDEDKWVPYDILNAYLIGKDYNSMAYLHINSFKALIRKLRSWKLPKGIILKVEDFRYEGMLLIQGN